MNMFENYEEVVEQHIGPASDNDAFTTTNREASLMMHPFANSSMVTSQSFTNGGSDITSIISSYDNLSELDLVFNEFVDGKDDFVAILGDHERYDDVVKNELPSTSTMDIIMRQNEVLKAENQVLRALIAKHKIV